MDQATKWEFVERYRKIKDEVTGKRYPVHMILRVIDYSSAAFYSRGKDDASRKRGQVTSMSDSELKTEIKEILESIIIKKLIPGLFRIYNLF